jgi:hypothetical protein
MPSGRTWAAVLCTVGLFASLAPTASAIDEVNTKKFRQEVTVNGILQHARSLQAIANRNGGTRASGTPGYDESAAYVAGRLRAAGYKVTEQEFTFPFYRENSSSLTQVSPEQVQYETAPYEYSGDGEVTGRLVAALNNEIPAPAEPGSSAGCAVGDYRPASPDEPEIALVQRGTCTFREKVDNAVTAGYDGVIIFNEGQPGREEMFVGTLSPPLAPVPVLGLSYADAVALTEAMSQGDVVMSMAADVEYDPNAKTKNIIADSRQGDPDKVLVVGAHLDSVTAGPGINDNGSGTAGILEIAEELAELKGPKLRQKVRFAFWGAEESGLLGSEHYVDSLGDEGIHSIFANLNFDMIGSPNYVRFVYDGDGSSTTDPATGQPVAGPPGSAQIEDLFNRYFGSQGLPTEPTAFDGRSDYGPFIAVGIPAGGLFSGAEGIKTPEQAQIYGGTAGEQYDPCYHQACDTIANLSTKALFELGDAAAHAVLTLARTKTGFFEDGSRGAGKGKGKGRGHKRGSFRAAHSRL